MPRASTYKVDDNISGKDIVFGSDGDKSFKSKNYSINALKTFFISDLQASNQDNVIKSLSFISNNTTQGVKPLTELTNLINGYTAFTVASSEIYFFKLTFQSRFYVFTFKDIGKGDYGTGQTQITESNLQIISEKDLALDTLEEDSNTDTINLFNIGSTAINDAVNALNPPIEIQPISEGFTIFKATQDGTEKFWLYTGDSGTYGLNSGQTLLSEFDLLKEESLMFSGLEALDEGNGIGWRLVGRDPANYGNIGLNAVDLSYSNTSVGNLGSTGELSFSVGFRNEASGKYSFALGKRTLASGDASFASGSFSEAIGNDSVAIGTYSVATNTRAYAQGQNTLASGGTSHAEGSGTVASGNWSHSQGNSNFARGDGEHSGGLYGTDYTPNSFKPEEDRLVNYGNGLDANNRSDAFTIYKNGAVRFFRATLASITNTVKQGMLIFNSGDNNRPTIHNGTDWEGLAYKSEVDKATITIDLTEVLTLDFYASQNLRIDSVTNLNGTPTTTILVNDVAYTFGNLISQGDKITVSVDVYSVINLNGSYE